MVDVFIVDSSSSEPFGSIARAVNKAMCEVNILHGFPEDFDYRTLPRKYRDPIGDEVCRITRGFLGTPEQG